MQLNTTYDRGLAWRPLHGCAGRHMSAVLHCRQSGCSIRQCRYTVKQPSKASPRASIVTTSSSAGPAHALAVDQPGKEQLKVVVVGASAAGLAAAAALARDAGCVVEVHESRLEPHRQQPGSTIVALGKRGLQALTDLNLDLSATLDQEATQQGATTTTSSSSSSSGSQGAITGHAKLELEPLPGLTLLLGFVVLSHQAASVEVYATRASRSKPRAQRGPAAAAAGTTAGIAAIDEASLTRQLLSAAQAAATTAHSSSTAPPQPPLVLGGSSAGMQAASTAAQSSTPKAATTTALPTGATLAPTAEAAQEAAMPPVVPAPGTTAGVARGEQGGSVSVHYHSQLVLLDTANKQATFMGEGGQASVSHYDLLVAADAYGGGELVVDALQELQQRQEEHHYPAGSARATGHSNSSSGGSSGSRRRHGSGAAADAELEYLTFGDMPGDSTINALLRASAPLAAVGTAGAGGLIDASVSSHHAVGPRQGWVLAWTGQGAKAVKPGFSSTSTGSGGGDAGIIPGGPSCTVLAWPGVANGTWSGCVVTDPQVFEALRSQSDYEQLLQSVSGPGGVKLPGSWVVGIAEALKQHQQSKTSVPAAVGPPLFHVASPEAGLLMLTPAAIPSAHSPQLLSPAVALGLSEAAWLAKAVPAATAPTAAATGQQQQQGLPASAGGSSSSSVRQASAQVLQDFDKEFGPEAAALQKLLSQLSWLRHPFSPAANAAASCIVVGSLAWIWRVVFGAARAGLALQWRCLVTLLPVVAGVQRVLLYKLGLGRPDTPVSRTTSVPDASYRQPKAAADAAGMMHSTSLDSGVHLDGSAAATSGTSPASNPAVPTAVSAYTLNAVLDAVEPTGTSFVSALYTSDMPPSSLWRLLQLAPLLLAILWGAAFWFAWQAIHWGMWAYKACGWAQVAVA